MDKSGLSLKDTLDAIWNRPGVMFPRHRCWFNSNKVGHRITDEIYVRAGRPVGKAAMKAKGKGYSFLPKNYMAAWIFKFTDDC